MLYYGKIFPSITKKHGVYEFNVFHVRALYYTKKTNLQQVHKESFIINRNTLLHVSTLLGHLQEELSVTVPLGLQFFSGEGPRSRRYGRTAALRLIVQPCDEHDADDYYFLSFS
jgi:hypothetical protein